MVDMLIHARANVRAKNAEGRDLAWYVRQQFIKNVSRTVREVDPYFLDVVGFLEQEGTLPKGTHAEWKDEIDQLIKEYGKTAYVKRDPFVDEWVLKRQELQQSPDADKATSKAKVAE
jgi:hypothetical protein